MSQEENVIAPAASQAGTAMVMGIVAIFLSFSPIGFILAIMARVRARKLLAEGDAIPAKAFSNAKVARHTSTIALLLSVLWLVVIIVAVRG